MDDKNSITNQMKNRKRLPGDFTEIQEKTARESNKKPFPERWGREFVRKLVLALACGFSLLLTLYAGLFVMLALTDLLNDARAGTLPLKTLERTLQRFILADSYLGHCYPSSRSSRLDISRLRRTDGEPYSYYIVFQVTRQWGNWIFSIIFL